MQCLRLMTQPEVLTRASLMAASRFFFACTFFSRKNSSRSSSSSSPCKRHAFLQSSCHAHDELDPSAEWGASADPMRLPKIAGACATADDRHEG